MCEILVRAQDGMVGHFAGDPVFIAPDGHSWGRRESKQAWLASGQREVDWSGNFIIVKLPGVDPARVAFLREGERFDVLMTVEDEQRRVSVSARFRRQRIDLRNLARNASERNAMNASGEITVTEARTLVVRSARPRDLVREDEIMAEMRVKNPTVERAP